MNVHSAAAARFAAMFVLLLAPVATTTASPLFHIGEGGTQSWTQSLASGLIQPATNLSQSAQAFYQSQVDGDPDVTGFELAAATLTPDIVISDGSESHLSLVMGWDHPTNDTVIGVAAWDYVYDVDPDLTGTRLSFSLFAPPGVWDVSLELIDSAGRSRGWFLPMPAAVWQTLVIRPDLAAAQGPFTFFHNQPGFDITQVVAIRLNESGILSMPFSVPNPSGSIAWNAWNHLSVVPAPASGLLLALGLAGVFVGRRKRLPC